jgi:hypothetical protein
LLNHIPHLLCPWLLSASALYNIPGQFKLVRGAEKQRPVVQLEELRLSAKDLTAAEVPSGGGGAAGGSAQVVGKQGSADTEIGLGSRSIPGSIQDTGPQFDI